MRLLCNGVALDLLSGAALSFKKSNPLFAFDALTCERTQSFDIPATPHNERVMQLAKLPAFRGEGMRRRFDAELQDGIVVKRGYLYVDAYNNGKYKAVFVTGELVGLQRIKEAGKVADIVNQDERLTYTGVGADARGTLQTWQEVRYKNESHSIVPSWSLAGVIRECAERIGVTISTEGIGGIRVIPNELQRTSGRDTMLTSERATGNYLNTINEDVFEGMITTSNATLRTFHEVAVPDGGGYFTEETVYDESYSIQVYMTEQNIVLTFPDDTPPNYYLIRPTYPVTIVARNLAGKSIQIPRDTRFFVLADGDEVDEQTGGPYPEREGGEFYTHRYTLPLTGSNLTFSLDVRIESADSGNVEAGQLVWLRDNLPDVSVVELLKLAAALAGKVLNYTDADGVSFDNINYVEWETLDETAVAISVDEVARRFVDWGQTNVLQFDGWENTRENERIRVVYRIDNDNIERENVLQSFPFSEGGIEYDGEVEVVLVRDGLEAGNVQTLSKADINSEFLQRIDMMANKNIQTLCDASTSVNIKVRMTLAQYERMSAKTAILYRGTRYVWTEATWSKEVATLKLSKIL